VSQLENCLIEHEHPCLPSFIFTLCSIFHYFVFHYSLIVFTSFCEHLTIYLGPIGDVFDNELKNREKEPRGRRYSDTIKRLAITFHYASATAYRIFRFPHQTVLNNQLFSSIHIFQQLFTRNYFLHWLHLRKIEELVKRTKRSTDDLILHQLGIRKHEY